jgi:hypothetical protein
MSSITAAKAQPALRSLQATDASSTDAPEAQPAQRLGLSPYDELAATALVMGDGKAELVEHVRQRADALAGPDRDSVRLRVIARALSIAAESMNLLQSLLGARLAKGDLKGVELMEKTLARVEKRLDLLLTQHREESHQGQKPLSVHVGHVDALTVRGGGE